MRLIAENLSIERCGRMILDGISFAVAGREALVLTGRTVWTRRRCSGRWLGSSSPCAVAITEAGRPGEVRCLGGIDTTEAAALEPVAKHAAKSQAPASTDPTLRPYPS